MHVKPDEFKHCEKTAKNIKSFWGKISAPGEH